MKPINQDKFDKMYLKESNANLDEVCLTESKIPAIEFIGAGINKLQNAGYSEEEIKSIFNTVINDFRFETELYKKLKLI